MSSLESPNDLELHRASTRGVRLALVCLYLVCSATSSLWSIQRYRECKSGWPWDLAHVNQSFWALTHGLDRITVRPMNHYAREGPEPWRSVHLAPLRALLLPAYAVWPRAETLLVGHCFTFWLSIFGVARLAGGASRSGAEHRPYLALLGALAWVTTPAAFVFALNDCRPLQLGVPFLLWAVLGFIERRPWLFVVSALAALACRQEYGVAVAMLAVLPALQPERPATKWKWRAVSLAIGLGWFAGYFLYIDQMFGPTSVARYFAVPSSFARKGWADVLGGFVVTGGSLAVLTGGWCLLALRSPRYLLASLPLVTMIVQRNLTRLLPGDAEWHMVRYAAIPVALWTAGGAVALRRAKAGEWATWWKERPAAQKWLFGGTAVFLGWIGPACWIQSRLAVIAPAVATEDCPSLREWIAKIPADAIVWTDYSYSAMLSGRARLYSFDDPPWARDVQLHPPPAEEWVIARLNEVGPESQLGQALRSDGFEEVFHGNEVDVLRRTRNSAPNRGNGELGIH